MKNQVKRISLMLTVVLLLTSLALPAMAVTPETSWADVAAADFHSGSGTKADPYIITTAEELAHLAVLVNNGTNLEGKFLKIADNTVLDLAAHQWLPIGNDHGKSFKGTFDGNHAEIKNLKLTNGYYDYGCAMFGRVQGGTVKNLTVHAVIGDATLKKGSAIPSFAVLVGALYGGTVQNCTVYCDMNVTNGKLGYYYAGAVGYARGISGGAIPGVLENIQVYGSLKVAMGATENKPCYFGGVVARTNSNVNIRNCSNYADLTYDHKNGQLGCVGGIAGVTQADNPKDKLLLENCVNYGRLSVVNATDSLMGGMVGNSGYEFVGKGIVECHRCVNVGSFGKVHNPSGNNSIGGIIGKMNGNHETFLNCFTTDSKIYGTGKEANSDGLDTCVAGISLETLTGARVRIDTTADATSGIRFDSKVSSAYDRLKTVSGVSVELGTVIAPSRNIKAVHGSYDKIAELQSGGANTYVKVPFSDTSSKWQNSLFETEAGYDKDAHYFSGAIAKIFSQNFTLDYSAVAYLKVSVGDWNFTFYADDGVADNVLNADRVRNIRQVAAMAYEDGTANSNKYSEAQMQVLKSYLENK